MGTEKTKSFPIRMPEAVMGRLRESAALANLRHGEFINNLLVMYESRIRKAYEIAGIDLRFRGHGLDIEFFGLMLAFDEEGPTESLANDFRQVGEDFNSPSDAEWTPEIILPKGAK